MTETSVRLPPSNQDAEESVLGAILLSPVAVEAAAEELTPAEFYRGSHGRIFAAALALYAEGEPVDAITVAAELDRRGQLADLGGPERLHELATLVPATSNVRHYARIVRETATLRGLTSVGDRIGRLGWEGTGAVSDLVEQAERLVFDLAQARHRSDFVSIGVSLDAVLARMEAVAAAGRAVVGVPTGFKDLDRLTSGLQLGNFVLLAGRPSMGKSAVLLAIAAHLTLREDPPRPVGIFSLEMSKDEVTQRLLGTESLVDSVKIRNGSLDREEWQRVHAAAARIAAAPLLLDDDGLTTLLELRSRARRLKLRHPDLALIAVDYLQLMTSGGSFDSRVQEVSGISRSLKVLARELEVPVLALSQLSRAPEQRHDARPVLSDLRESGALEQDADVVLFLYRDEVYHPEDETQHGIAELNLAKHRNGPTAVVKLSFVKRFARFSDLALPGLGTPT